MTPMVFQFYINSVYFRKDISISELGERVRQLVERKEFEMLLQEESKEE